jgi:putative phosphoesterase
VGVRKSFMKICFFSDVHGNNLAFNQFLKATKSNKEISEIIFLGDFVGYYYSPEEIISYCRLNNIQCILGNHDQNLLDIIDKKIEIKAMVEKYGHSYKRAIDTISSENINFLRKLPKFKILELNGKSLFVCHGSPEDLLSGRIYPDTDLSKYSNLIEKYDYIITGQTHHKLAKNLGKLFFLNPGSIGQQRDGQGCSYLILDLKKNTFSFHTIEYDITKLEEQIDLYDKGWVKLKEVLRRSNK